MSFCFAVKIVFSPNLAGAPRLGAVSLDPRHLHLTLRDSTRNHWPWRQKGSHPGTMSNTALSGRASIQRKLCRRPCSVFMWLWLQFDEFASCLGFPCQSVNYQWRLETGEKRRRSSLHSVTLHGDSIHIFNAWGVGTRKVHSVSFLLDETIRVLFFERPQKKREVSLAEYSCFTSP